MKFENYSDFSLFFDDNDDEFSVVLDYRDENRYGFAVYLHIPTGKYYFVDEDENDATFLEVFPVAKLRYDVRHDIQNDDALHTLFDNVVCGEHLVKHGIEYIWFDDVKNKKL